MLRYQFRTIFDASFAQFWLFDSTYWRLLSEVENSLNLKSAFLTWREWNPWPTEVFQTCTPLLLTRTVTCWREGRRSVLPECNYFWMWIACEGFLSLVGMHFYERLVVSWCLEVASLQMISFDIWYTNLEYFTLILWFWRLPQTILDVWL